MKIKRATGIDGEKLMGVATEDISAGDYLIEDEQVELEDCACHEPNISDRITHTKEKCYIKEAPELPEEINITTLPGGIMKEYGDILNQLICYLKVKE